MEKRYFEAGNLYLATYLLYSGFGMKGLRGSGKAKRILFDDCHEVNQVCEEFYNDSEARQLFACYRRAKDYLFQNGV